MSRHLLILLYLVVSCSGLFFTLLRVELPFVPAFLRAYAYQMMAPYQGFNKFHQDFYARGHYEDGRIEDVDLAPYFPYPRAQRYIRSTLSSFEMVGRSDTGAILQTYARQILEHERAQGRAFAELEFGSERWPVSLEGYDILRPSEGAPFWQVTVP